MSNDYNLVPVSLAIRAMRSNGYKNAAYAVAELIDNSVQAGATSVEMLCLERRVFVGQRERLNIDSIAILDNGCGMEADILRQALQFGNGSRLDDRTGIGRFGMGLPSASISQCKRLDVWSWTTGAESALHTHIDLNNVESGGQTSVPEPELDPIPIEWRQKANSIGTSGTLVVWSQLDLCKWKTGLTIIRKSDLIVGRMYRRFIGRDGLTIRMAVFENGSSTPTDDEFVLANDPGYLMVGTSTPEPYREIPLFQHDGDAWEQRETFELTRSDGSVEKHPITIRYSLAKEEARRHPQAGSTPYGKHAAQNIGVSLLRASRELELDQNLVSVSEARDRWWGVEIDFPPALDEIFGVDNSKQGAHHFSETAATVRQKKAGTGAEWREYISSLEDTHDPSLPLANLIRTIDDRIVVMRKVVEAQNRGNRQRQRRHEPDSAEFVATTLTRQRQADGYAGTSDAGEALPTEQRIAEVSQELRELGYSDDVIDDIVVDTITNGLKYQFAEASLQGMSIFSVKFVAGEIVITLNTDHPAYNNLDQVLAMDASATDDPAELADRLRRASNGLRLLLSAWARMEDEEPNDRARAELQEVRNRWGAMAYRFLDS